jgi:predicted hotdog family 3-hydroxylacyl-ACP dehydratase
VIDHAGIAALIPHDGAMVLLDMVEHWSPAGIVCTAISHRDAGNPLAAEGVLDVICGIEYAAQAMAVHGALTGATAVPRLGYLASVRDLDCAVVRLDTLGELTIAADQLHAEAGRVIYHFALTSDGRPVLSGRAAVVLDGTMP